ncbi:MAG: hypothetical protein M1818_003005 [Claussenomyces sp. TS43310]|nr:MAG: hypothetical protein M1818_003005 [Claussenomyces sp. TS43310]
MRAFISKTIATLLVLARAASGQSGSSVFANFVDPPSVADEGFRIGDNYSLPVFNDFGFVVRGNTTSGEDFHLWMFMYRQQDTAEFIINEDICQTSMVHGVFSSTPKPGVSTSADAQTMHDTPFVNKGQDIEDYQPIGTLRTSESATQKNWTFEGRVFTSAPPLWKAQGTHGGVQVDLDMRQRGQEFYHAGLFSDLSDCAANASSANYNCSGSAGGIIHLDVTGSIVVGNDTLTIDTAYAVHERIIQAGSVPSRLASASGDGSNWLHGWGKELSYFAFTAAQGPYAIGMLNADNRTTVTSGATNVTIAETAHWLDPKTNQLNPYQWQTTALLSAGRLDSTVTAFGRSYYLWVRNGGTVLVHQFVANCVSTLTRPDGSTLTEDGVAFLEYMRTLYVQPTP